MSVILIASVFFSIQYFNIYFFGRFVNFIGVESNFAFLYFFAYMTIFSLLLFSKKTLVITMLLFIVFPIAEIGRFASFNNTKTAKFTYEAVVKSHLYLRKFGSSYNISIFYDEKEQLFSESTPTPDHFPMMLLSTGFFGNNTLLWQKDAHDYANAKFVKPTIHVKYIAFISHYPEKTQPLVDRFAEFGRELKLIGEYTIPHSRNEKIWIYQ